MIQTIPAFRLNGFPGVADRAGHCKCLTFHHKVAQNGPIFSLKSDFPYEEWASKWGKLMARAKRHYLPGYAWHITHRCHEREFLLKFGRDRRRWMQWLFEAKKRYGLCI